jgi:beta-carotene ketolase (CrtW type)
MSILGYAMNQDQFKGKTGPGVALASAIILTWLLHLVWLLQAPLNIGLILWGIPVQSILFVGLFITGHDAMHGSLAPGYYRINKTFGSVAVFLYAAFSYKKLLPKHGLHHRYPGRDRDPDYHNGVNTSFWSWYVNFMKQYLTFGQLMIMALLFNLLLHVAGFAVWNIILFWVVPALLSTVQLFLFGTYLPHKEPPGGYDNEHHAQSNAYPVWLSFLTCFHFGYHLEHHLKPQVPWWQLPRFRHHRLAE